MIKILLLSLITSFVFADIKYQGETINTVGTYETGRTPLTVAEPYILEVQKGSIPDKSIIWKFGYVSSANGVEETIWENGGLYVYHLGYGVNAKQIDVVSTNPADVYETMVEGLDANGSFQTESIDLNGTTAATSIKTYSRVFRAYNNNGVVFLGTISISETGEPLNIVAKINPIEQQTLMGIYTIPLGYTGYLFFGTSSIGGGKESSIRYKTRLFGKIFRTQERFPLYQNSIEAIRPYFRLPELTDIEIRSLATAAGSDISANFGILLIKN